MAILPIMLVFTMQPVYDQKSSYQLGRIQDIVYAAKEEAKQEGRFTEDIVARMKDEIALVLNIPPEQIIFESDDAVKYRFAEGEERLIHYRLEVPIKNVMAGASLFKMRDDENSYNYVIDSYTASEKI